MDVKNFNFLSTGFTERVRFVDEGSTPYPTGTGGNYVDIEVPNTSDLMLVRASVSFDGEKWYDESSPLYSTTGTGPALEVTSSMRANYIRLFFTAPAYATSGTTLYYRVVGYKI